MVKRFHVFRGLLCNPERFLVNFCDNVFKYDVKAGSCEGILVNEGKDVKQ